ncbi:MAG: AMP-binding protein [Desulfosarcinaceae bacterium]
MAHTLFPDAASASCHTPCHCPKLSRSQNRVVSYFFEHVVVVGHGDTGSDLSFDEWASNQSDKLQAAPPNPCDSCFWLYSSGSTGLPKGTVHFQHDIVYASETYGKQVLQAKSAWGSWTASDPRKFPISLFPTVLMTCGRAQPAR